MTDLGLLPYNLTRARIRTRSNSNFIFLLSQVSHHLLSNRSFTLKQPVGFTKTTRHFSVELKSNTQEETTES